MIFRDTVIGLALMTFSAVLFAGTWSFADVGGYVSPRMFPRFVSVCMFGFSAILFVRSAVAILRGRVAASDLPRFDAAATADFARRYRRIGLAALVALGYVLFVADLGYIPATMLLLVAMTAIFGARKWFTLAAVSVVGTGVLYATFRILFKVPLPRSDWF